MDQAEGLVPERRVRRWRSVAEKRRIVELTLVPGASVALVARAHGVNANQVRTLRSCKLRVLMAHSHHLSGQNPNFRVMCPDLRQSELNPRFDVQPVWTIALA
jgi:hypothetical protein